MTIKIKIGEKEIELSAQEARELHKSLGEIFAEKVVVREVVKEGYPVNVPVNPIVIERIIPAQPWRPFWNEPADPIWYSTCITCGSVSADSAGQVVTSFLGNSN